MSRIRLIVVAALALVSVLGVDGMAAQLMTRTLKDRPAIVVAAFGTSTRAQVTYDAFQAQLDGAFPEHEIRWAFTSEVIRERVNARWSEAGKTERLRSLQQALADLEAAGYTKVVVQPLHIFPGEEYQEVLHTVEGFPGLTIETGETLLERWEHLDEVVHALSADFLHPEEGCNVLVAHGTTKTHLGANITYLGLERHLLKRYPNAYLGAVDGLITREDALEAAKACSPKKVRFIPVMFVAGDHIMNDIMGEDEADDPVSWHIEMKRAGFETQVLLVPHDDSLYFKGLGFNPEITAIFLREIERALGRL